MTRIITVIFFLTGTTVAGLIVLSNWQIPAPTVTINKVVLNEKLPK